jgi:hypothetical protein
MKIKNSNLLKISHYIGLIAFVGAWIIFSTWAAARYFFAWDFEFLEFIGLFWMIGFFWLLILAGILLIIYLLLNLKNLHRKILVSGFMILINIPAVIIILYLQGEIGDKVFVNLKNETGMTITKLTLHGKLKNWEIGSLENGSSTVFNYDPPYLENDARSYQLPDSLKIIITHNKTSDTIAFPTFTMGNCRKLILDKDFGLKSR